jgi:hypothetical protein
MHHGGRSLQREAHDRVGRRTVEIGDEADPAGVVLFDDEWRIGVILVRRGGGGTSLLNGRRAQERRRAPVGLYNKAY